MIIDRFYKSESVNRPGTLAQLKALLNRNNFDKKVTKNYHDAAFFDMVVDCHVIAAAMKELKINDITDKPEGIPVRLEVLSDVQKCQLMKRIAANNVDKYVCRVIGEVLENIADGANNAEIDVDGVYNYATAILKYGLVHRVSIISTSSGDGERQLRHWWFALLSYHLSGKTKFRLEAFLINAAVKALLPERFAEQLTWSRFVNVTGGPEKHLDADDGISRRDCERLLAPTAAEQKVLKILCFVFIYTIRHHCE